MTAAPKTYTAPQLAEYLGCYDAAGKPDAQAVLKLSMDGGIPPPDIRPPGPGDEAYWNEKTIHDFIDGVAEANVGAENFQPLLVDGKTLAKMLSVSERWVAAHRYDIIGAQRIGGPGGPWRYNVEIIEQRILAGKDILKETPKPPKKYFR